MIQKDRKKLTKKLDILFSKFIRTRDGRCLHCGKTENLQCSHIAGRKSLAGRWNDKNAITLCYACHFYWWHKEPVEAAEWLKNNYPEFYNEGVRIRQTTVKNLDLNALVEKYK